MITQQTQHEHHHAALLEGLRAHLQPLAGDARQYDGLLAQIGPARFALLGEASHGTDEFYRERSEITKRLITEKGFTAVAVEADWQAARRARQRYACFDHAAEDSQAYGYAASFGLKGSCEDEVVQQLREMNRRAADVTPTPGLERDEAFYAQQNARRVRNAEEYYRTMFQGRVSSWNLRDSHMAQTLHALDGHLGAGGAPPRIAVWAHNSHLGDASATEMGERGEWNVGQLVRERHADDAVLVGFSTHRGWVTAPARRRCAALAGGVTATAACHRCDLPARHRTPEPLFLHPPGAAVRCRHTHRRHQRRGAAGRGPGVDRRRGA